jgi:GT2 family glycosyltransferase
MGISVIIRNRNEATALEFLLKVLNEKYFEEIDEIIVLDNLSSDDSEKITNQYGARFVKIEKFSYGSSANIGASEAKNEIVVIFSAHSYPVSHDFFKLIKKKFLGRENELAGLRCLHNNTDYKFYLNNGDIEKNSNLGGLIFSGSAFNRELWKKHPFNNDVRTFEDKEWSMRMNSLGYKIEMVPSIFCYYIHRNYLQKYFRFRNDMIGSFQMFGVQPSYKFVFYIFFKSLFLNFKSFIVESYFDVRKMLFSIKIKIKSYKGY